MNHAATVWFEEFMPAMETFNSQNVDFGELYSKVTYDLQKMKVNLLLIHYLTMI